ncbi:hypothetical protein GOP47_0025270 [Adiantum capillus-veneris]|uniref:Uncharacterized protein n=1 Tax=Adiantum capillus-veneris TaxID=13818 RepID=A0A9D4U2I4_ADICA|nr:hypothetical protein GOP47_0025270 [Adiantum capillus-veneris]
MTVLHRIHHRSCKKSYLSHGAAAQNIEEALSLPKVIDATASSEKKNEQDKLSHMDLDESYVGDEIPTSYCDLLKHGSMKGVGVVKEGASLLKGYIVGAQEDCGDVNQISHRGFPHLGSVKSVHAPKEHIALGDNQILVSQEMRTCSKIGKESKVEQKNARVRKVTAKMRSHKEGKVALKAPKLMEHESLIKEKCISSTLSNEIKEMQLEDLETILLKYMGEGTISSMYFSLRSTYINFNKIEPSFRSFCSDVKHSDSATMVRKIVGWLIDTNKIEVMLKDNPLSIEDIVICG